MCDGTNWVKWAGRFITGDAPVSGTSIGGNDTEIQYNNSGTFAGDSSLTWNGSVLAVTGDITYTGTIADVSDRRKKTRIKALDPQLEKIAQLKGVSFLMDNGLDSDREIGLIAQDVRKVYPTLVKEYNGIYSLNYIGLIAPLIEATKEQQKEIENLSTQNHELSRRLLILEGKVRPPLAPYNH
jgi:hypothetical protein